MADASEDWRSGRACTSPHSVPLATTNYGNQVAYNYGSVSNYFCYSSDTAHQCPFPDSLVKKDVLGNQTYEKIARAREFYRLKQWAPAKSLFFEVLQEPDATLDAAEQTLLQYHLAHTHFALAEYIHSARQFQDVLDVYEEGDVIVEKSVRDSRYWLAQSLYHLERHADAAEAFQVFVWTHAQDDANGAEQVMAARLWLGLTLERLRRYSLAKVQLSCAYETRVQTLGPEHLDTLASRHHLANYLYKRKEYLEAQEHFHALLLIEDNFSGPEKAEAVTTRCMLAFCLAKAERYDEAEPHLERVFARLNSFPGLTAPQVRDEGLVCYWLGRIALRRHNSRSTREAESFFQRALHMISTFIDHSMADEDNRALVGHDRGKSSGEGKGNDHDLHDELVGCRCYLAHAMLLEHQYVAAEQMYRQILDTKDETRYDYIVASRNGLAQSVLGQRKPLEAKEILEDFVEERAILLEDCRHTGDDIGACLTTLGEIHMTLSNHAKARGYFQQAVAAVPKISTIHYCWTKFHLATALFDLREFESACSIFQDLYQYATGGHNISDALLFESECWLSWCLCEVGKYDEAEGHLRPVFSIMSAATEGPPAAMGDFYLGKGHYYQGRCDLNRRNITGATEHLRLGLGKLGRLRGPDDPSYLECQYYLGWSFILQKNMNEARRIFEDLRKAKVSVEPVKTIRLVLAPYWLGHIAFTQRQCIEAERHFAECLSSLSGDALPLHSDISAGFARFWHAKTLLGLQRFDVCSEILQSVIAQELNQEEIGKVDSELCRQSRLLVGQSLHAVERFGEACDYLKPAVADLDTNPSSEISHSHWTINMAILMDSLSELGRYAEAIPHLLRLRTQQDLINAEGGDTIKGIICYWLGRRAFESHTFVQDQVEGHFINAQKSLTSARFLRYKHLRMDCKHFLGRTQLKGKKYTDADDMLRELARQQYESGEVSHAVDNQYWYGTSLLEQHMYTAAIPIFQKITSGNEPGRIQKNAVAASQQALGQCLFALNKYTQAKSHFKIALQFADQLDGHGSMARMRLAHCNFSLCLYGEAKICFQDCLSQGAVHPTRVPLAHYWLGRSFFEMCDWEQADHHLETAVIRRNGQTLPEINAVEARFYVGRARIKLEQYSEALTPLYSLTKYPETLSPKIVLGQYCTALALYECGRFVKSRQRLVEYRPKFKETEEKLAVDFLIARCLFGMSGFSKAQAELERIIKIPWYSLCAKKTDQTVMLAHYELARIAYRYQEWNGVLDHIYAAVQRHETIHAPDSALSMVECQRYKSIALRALGRNEEAAEIYAQVLDDQVDDTIQAPRQTLLEVTTCLSRTKYRLEKREGYEESTQEAYDWPGKLCGSSHPYNVRRQILLADLAFRFGDFPRAEGLHIKLLALMESSAEARKMTPVSLAYFNTMLAVTLSKLDKREEAISYALKALEADCTHGHHCRSVDGFAEEFPELLSVKRDQSRDTNSQSSATTCSEPTHRPKVTILTTKPRTVSEPSTQLPQAPLAVPTSMLGRPPPATMLRRARNVTRLADRTTQHSIVSTTSPKQQSMENLPNDAESLNQLMAATGGETVSDNSGSVASDQ